MSSTTTVLDQVARASDEAPLRLLLESEDDIAVVGEAGDGRRPSPWSARPVPTWC
jgi:hypothetical protein